MALDPSSVRLIGGTAVLDDSLMDIIRGLSAPAPGDLAVRHWSGCPRLPA